MFFFNWKNTRTPQAVPVPLVFITHSCFPVLLSWSTRLGEGRGIFWKPVEYFTGFLAARYLRRKKRRHAFNPVFSSRHRATLPKALCLLKSQEVLLYQIKH